jgi:hypothetical protein
VPPVRWLPLLLLFACDDLKDFRGNYSGQIIGGEFVRSCFRQDTQLKLRFDPNLAVVRDDVSDALPNTISTVDPASEEQVFTDTVLEPMRNLVQDPLGELDFPGPQRLRNYMLLARPQSGPLAGRDALVVVSLLASESVEVRVVARPADDKPDCPADSEPQDGGVDQEPRLARPEFFGLWRMRRVK